MPAEKHPGGARQGQRKGLEIGGAGRDRPFFVALQAENGRFAEGTKHNSPILPHYRS